MGLDYGVFFFVVLSTFMCGCGARRWDNSVNYQRNIPSRISPSQFPSGWPGYNVQQRGNAANTNSNAIVRKPQVQVRQTYAQQQQQQQQPHQQQQQQQRHAGQNSVYRSATNGHSSNQINTNTHVTSKQKINQHIQNSIKTENLKIKNTSPKPHRTADFVQQSRTLNTGHLTKVFPSAVRNLGRLPTLTLTNPGGNPKSVLTVNTPNLSHQIVGGSIVNGHDGPINYISKERAPKKHHTQQNIYNVNPNPNEIPGSNNNPYDGSLPADVHVHGDPDDDQTINVKVKTPEKMYDVNLERMPNNILHEDVRFLKISVDENGKTVFQEQFKTVDLQAKAKEMNYFHDLQSGTFLSVQAFRKNSGEKPRNYVEGVLFDEMIVAAPHNQKRHKRSLYPDTHTVYRKDSVDSGAFHFDSVEVPGVDDLLKSQKPHIRKKRQFRQSSVGIPPRASPSRSQTQETRPPPKIEPELLLFVDFALFREFDGDSNELLEYLLHFWHAVNWKYLTIALSGSWPVIDLKIREIGVFKEPNAQPFIESSRIKRGSKLFSLYDAMDSLQKWLIRYENALPIHDIAFLQTGENACRKIRKNSEKIVPFNPPNILKSLRQGIPFKADSKSDSECVTGTAGVAYVRGACLSAPMLRGNAFNFGIGEASNSFNGVIIAAHEVGHLLGAYHDGESDAGSCSPKSGYIMSYTRDDSYKFSRFSECSIRSFQNFLRMDRARCLLQRSSRDTLKFPTTFPGKFMSLRQQCLRFTGGPPCEEGPTQCEHLCCDDRKGEWRYTRSEPAVDGTECSNMKVCLNGQCVPLATIG